MAKRIESSRRPLLTSHIRLDGDALGSGLALAHILKGRGARPHVVNDSEIPKVYQFLPGAEEVGRSAAALHDDYDLVVALDTPTWSRASAVRKALRRGLPVVSMDHHPPIERIGDPEWVDTTMSSVGEMVHLLARARGWPITPEAATCLYVAIMTDTGRFTFPNTTPSALRAAADLIELGADHALISEKVYQQESPALVMLRAEAMQGLKLFAGGGIALITVTQEMLQRRGVDPIDIQEMANLPRCVAGAVVGVLLREMGEEGKIKVSLRARNRFNVEPVAREFGGGGHKQASGCEIPGDLAQVERIIINTLADRLQADGLSQE